MKETLKTTLQLVLLIGMIGIGYQLYQLQQQNAIVSDNVSVLKEQFEMLMSAANQPEALGTEEEAPAFTLLDENEKKVSLVSLGNQEKLIVFSQPECDYCKEFLPHLKKYAATKKDSLAIVVIDVGASTEELKKSTWFTDTNIIHLSDSTGEIANTYKVTSTPTSYLISKDNRVLFGGNISDFKGLEDLEYFLSEADTEI